MTHYSSGADVDRQGMVQRMVVLLSTLCFSSPPTVPSENKWTKLGPCIAFFILAGIFRVLNPLVRLAYDSLKGQHDFLEA